MRPDLMRDRRGFSLAEIMVALVLLGIVAGGIMGVVMRQQQFYRSATEVIDTRQQIRQAAAVVPVDMRGVSSVGNDILEMTDSSLYVRGNIGSSIMCSHGNSGAGSSITIPPIGLASGSYFTTFLTRPKVNDVILVFDDKNPGNQDDDWMSYTISRIDSTLVGCASFTDAVKDVAAYRYIYETATPLSATIVDGSPMRFARQVKYSLYRSATDGLSWMGYRECRGDGSACSNIQPVAGPYRPYAAGDTLTSGLTFVYRDSTGAVTATPAMVARVEMFVRGQTQSPVALGGGKTNTVYRDYQKVTIAIRNRQ
ncbi:MAG TPA: prepilin-type N-terminal cleavage/methylation domain-containing protein [Gemmatimonadaceae bacterium]|nr:prepilin-type N-terminal cleavage/methylation domain-containing protein [Gemmatimonadaceae bacterium]